MIDQNHKKDTKRFSWWRQSDITYIKVYLGSIDRWLTNPTWRNLHAMTQQSKFKRYLEQTRELMVTQPKYCHLSFLPLSTVRRFGTKIVLWTMNNGCSTKLNIPVKSPRLHVLSNIALPELRRKMAARNKWNKCFDEPRDYNVPIRNEL